MTIATPPRKRRKKKDPRGRKPVQESIRANWCGADGRTVRFAISEDVVQHLKKMHDFMFGVMYHGGLGVGAGYDPYRTIRIEFMRFDDLHIPGVFVRIEPPTYAPKGHRMWRAPTGRRFFVEVLARDIGVLDAQPPCQVEYLFDETMPRVLGGGMLFTFPDHVMIFEGKKRRVTSAVGETLRPPKPVRPPAPSEPVQL